MELQCPKCNHELERNGIQKRHCPACGSDFKVHFTCDKCGNELELLQACGAANLWCSQCNELKSKSSAPSTLKEI